MGSNALIIFAKFPDGNVKTRLKGFLSEQKRVILYESLLNSTVNMFSTYSDADVFICFTPKEKEGYFLRCGLRLFPQTDGGLGMRMHDAFQHVFNVGYQKAIIVGTDIPKLTEQIVTGAFNLLVRNDVVFGPALDGGYYLVGLKRNYPEIFKEIEWSSPLTLFQSVKKAEECGLAIGFADELSDIDTIEDLKKTGIRVDL